MVDSIYRLWMIACIGIIAACMILVPEGYCDNGHSVKVYVNGEDPDYLTWDVSERDGISCAQSDGSVAALVSPTETLENFATQTIYTRKYTLSMSQPMQTNRFFLAFTQGSCKSAESRMKYIESGTFESFANPSFGFSLDESYNVAIRLSLDNLDVTTDAKLRPGMYSLTIRNENSALRKVSVSAE